MTAPDFTAGADLQIGAPTDENLSKVAKLADRQLTGERVVADLEARLKLAKEALRGIVEVELPDAITAAGLKEFTLKDGAKVTVEPFLTASLSDGRMAGAVDWLRQAGHDGMVVRVVTVTLPKGQDKQGERIVAALKKLGVEPEDKSQVNTTSLKAWAREYLTSEENKQRPLPLDVFGIYQGRRSKITVAKK